VTGDHLTLDPALAPTRDLGTGGRLGYLSGSPRVSTDPEAEASGARAHILGVSEAFEQLGWSVERFVVGDQVPRAWTGPGSQQAISKSFVRRLAADLMRLALGRLNARRARRLLRGRVDLVYERFGAFQALGAGCRKDGIPWILETNGPLFYEARVERKSLVLSGLARRLERAAYQQCDLLVCISHQLREIIIDLCGVPSAKTVVVPNGVDTSFFDPARYQPKRPFSGFTIGFIGNLYAWAGLDLLFEAVAELHQAGVDVNIVVVGDGLMRQRLEAQVEELALAEHVLFAGRLPRPAVPPYIAGFDIGYSGQVKLQIGEMYHSPLKIYEYMAMAKPVVASAFEDARAVIADGTTGFLFVPGDKEGLKEAVRRAVAAGPELERMGRMARADVVAHHSWTARVRMLLAEVERVLSSRA
jgi:glycosyltransferase involved in cell wall biosynthesis